MNLTDIEKNILDLKHSRYFNIFLSTIIIALTILSITTGLYFIEEMEQYRDTIVDSAVILSTILIAIGAISYFKSNKIIKDIEKIKNRLEQEESNVVETKEVKKKKINVL